VPEANEPPTVAPPDGECRMPEQVVKAWRDAPGAAAHGTTHGRSVIRSIVFRKTILDLLVTHREPGQLLLKRLYLLVRENADSAHVAIQVKEFDLLACSSYTPPSLDDSHLERANDGDVQQKDLNHKAT